MERVTEVHDTIDESKELKQKDDPDQLPQQPSNCSEPKTPSVAASSQDGDWGEQFNFLMPPPEGTVDVVEGDNVQCNAATVYVSQQDPSNAQSLNNLEAAVEELTFKNYKRSSVSLGDNSGNGEKLAARKGLWGNFRRLVGTTKEISLEETVQLSRTDLGSNEFLLPFETHRPLQIGQPNQIERMPENQKKLSGGKASGLCSGQLHTGKLTSPCQPRFTDTCILKGEKVASRSSSQFVTKGRAIVQKPKSGHACPASNLPHASISRVDDAPLYGGGPESGGLNLHLDGINLRDLLKPGRQMINKIERLSLFNRILELVDGAHSQGFALQQLRPSYFSVLPSKQVIYRGSFMSKELQDPPEFNIDFQQGRKKRCLDSNAHCNASEFMSRLKHHKVEETVGIRFKPQNTGCDFREEIKVDEPMGTSSTPRATRFSQLNTMESVNELRKMENSWYTSPEELYGAMCSFSSNVYGLGIIFFELFCCFETWELHAAAMLDLRRRILPAYFLAENPKEAGFCLWLLHPDPSSRPKTRDILLHDLLSEGRSQSQQGVPTSIDEEDDEADLLLHFLVILKEQKEKQATKLLADIGSLQSDIEEVNKRHLLRTDAAYDDNGLMTNLDVPSTSGRGESAKEVPLSLDLDMYKERLAKNVQQLEIAYYTMRTKVDDTEKNAPTRSDIDVLKFCDKSNRIEKGTKALLQPPDRVGNFFTDLCKYARHNRFEVRGRLSTSDILNSSNVICSLSFDRDEEYFAAAGVSKKIKVFEFNVLLDECVDVHYPSIEMPNKSKLSCVCWNSYIKNFLASTDYDGVVQLWDVSTGQGFAQFAEHKKRAWSVDFSRVNPIVMASGSDDYSVRLWSINERKCLDTIRTEANVCCVQFSQSSHMLAFGSADYKVFCYDLRYTRTPWCALAGHGKAVSYVRFLDSETLVSASTDSTLKIWNLTQTAASGLSSSDACSLTLSGHTNRKNFVGLSTHDGYITCGSETNEVYSYYRSFPMPMACHKFGSIDPITGQETSDDNSQFVSSVCWRGKSNMVVVANSSGSIKVLELV